MNCAYVTLISNDEYIWGGICLGLSFQKLINPSKYSFVFMVSEKVSNEGIKILEDLNIGKIIRIPAKEYIKASINYKVTRQKIEVFKLIEYDRICFLDADCILIDNLDKELETYEVLIGLHHAKRSIIDKSKINESSLIVVNNNMFFIPKTINDGIRGETFYYNTKYNVI